jgi:hypothetical protein
MNFRGQRWFFLLVEVEEVEVKEVEVVGEL